MKKILILSLALMLVMSVSAQENNKDGEVNMMSKRGEYILPVQGDFALGIDAMPILSYFGNMFNGNTSNNAAFRFVSGLYTSNYTIYGKYYLTDKSAIRGALQLGIHNYTQQEEVVMNQLIPDPLVKVKDAQNTTSTTIGIGADYLRYRGKGRVQGYYGGGLFLNYTTSNETYSYGNAITTDFTAPLWYDFYAGNVTSGGQRLLSVRGQSDFGVTVRGVVGVEYFIAPKISIGGEFSLGVYAGLYTKGVTTVERWNGMERETEEITNANDRYAGLENASSGSIFMMFHF